MRRRYLIPMNFIQEGYAFANIRWINLIQAIIVAIAILVPVIAFVPGIQAKIYVSIILLFPSCFITLIGINGLSITSYLSNVIEFKRYGRVYSKPTNADRITRQKNLEKKRVKQLKIKAKEEKKLAKEEAKLTKRRFGRKREDDEE